MFSPGRNVRKRAANDPSVLQIRDNAPTRAFFWLNLRHYARHFQQAGEGLAGAFSLIMKTDESFAALVIMKTFIFN